MEQLKQFPVLKKMVEGLLLFWPEHERFIKKRFNVSDNDLLVIAGNIAKKITQISGDNLQDYYKSYKWFCDMQQEEQLDFYRTGSYKFSTFSDTLKNVYSNQSIMKAYMRGLLLSYAIWPQHTGVLQYFKEVLKQHMEVNRYLEIGAGHGLFLSFAIEILGEQKALEVWDISETAISESKACLKSLGCVNDVSFYIYDLQKSKRCGCEYDFIVFTEVLEHLENPVKVMKLLYDLTLKGGYVFLSTPMNAPTIDHITNWEQPDELYCQINKARFDIVHSKLLPSQGNTIEKCLKNREPLKIILLLKKNTE